MYVQLYHDNMVSLDIGGQSLNIKQTTDYPWDGNIEFQLRCEQPIQFDLAFRIPDWCNEFKVLLNGQAQSAATDGGYAILSRQWTDGDTIVLDLAMPVERVMPHGNIRQAAGQVALQRGPLIYCLEEVDNGSRLANICIPAAEHLEASFDDQLFGGISVIEGEAMRIEPARKSAALYRFHSREDYVETRFRFKAIPYYLWANREPGEMRVWMRSC